MKRYIPLIVGVAIPIVFICMVLLVMLISTFRVRPAHNFLYILDADTSYQMKQYQNEYAVENNKLMLIPLISLSASSTVVDRTVSTDPQLIAVSPDTGVRYYKTPTLYEYDVRNQASKQIRFEDAQMYTLDPGPSSPDGYTITQQSTYGGFIDLFGSSYQSGGFVMYKGGSKRKFNGLGNGEYFSPGEFQVIGWIK
jgi:hypothetical protein